MDSFKVRVPDTPTLVDEDAKRQQRHRQVQMNDLGADRRNFITSTDYPENLKRVNHEALQRERPCNQHGTKEHQLAERNALQISKWNDPAEITDDGEEFEADFEKGNTHRDGLNRMVEAYRREAQDGSHGAANFGEASRGRRLTRGESISSRGRGGRHSRVRSINRAATPDIGRVPRLQQHSNWTAENLATGKDFLSHIEKTFGGNKESVKPDNSIPPALLAKMTKLDRQVDMSNFRFEVREEFHTKLEQVRKDIEAKLESSSAVFDDFVEVLADYLDDFEEAVWVQQKLNMERFGQEVISRLNETMFKLSQPMMPKPRSDSTASDLINLAHYAEDNLSLRAPFDIVMAGNGNPGALKLGDEEYDQRDAFSILYQLKSVCDVTYLDRLSTIVTIFENVSINVEPRERLVIVQEGDAEYLVGHIEYYLQHSTIQDIITAFAGVLGIFQSHSWKVSHIREGNLKAQYVSEWLDSLEEEEDLHLALRPISTSTGATIEASEILEYEDEAALASSGVLSEEEEDLHPALRPISTSTGATIEASEILEDEDEAALASSGVLSEDPGEVVLTPRLANLAEWMRREHEQFINWFDLRALSIIRGYSEEIERSGDVRKDDASIGSIPSDSTEPEVQERSPIRGNLSASQWARPQRGATAVPSFITNASASGSTMSPIGPPPKAEIFPPYQLAPQGGS